MIAACAAVMQAYERQAILKWIRLKHNVPHSPDSPASVQDLRSFDKLAQVVKKFRLDYQIDLEYVRTTDM